MTWHFVGYEEDECGCEYAVDVNNESGKRARSRYMVCPAHYSDHFQTGRWGPVSVDRDRIEAWVRGQRAILIGRAYLVSDDDEVEALVDWIADVIEKSGCVETS